jgi:hypothetical protein
MERKMLPKAVVAQMATVANRAIDGALLHGSPSMVAPPRTEVGFVAAIILRALSDIAVGWTPLCRHEGLALELEGVFCHASPIVTYIGSKGRRQGCELADLLIAVDYVRKGAWIRKATLIQAKMARAAGRVSMAGKSSQSQLELYQRWGVFDFEEAAYGLKRVDFNQGSGASDSGTFGVIDRHFCVPGLEPPMWTQHPAVPTPTNTAHHSELGTFMAEMVGGSAPHFGRDCTPALKTPFSKTVQRLLELTFHRSFTHKPTLDNAQMQRGVRAPAGAMLQMVNGPAGRFWIGAGGPPFVRGEALREDPDRPLGVPAVYIKVVDLDGGR